MATVLTIAYVTYIVVLAGCVLWRYIDEDNAIARHENRVYWVFSAILIGFTALRPFGAGMDDPVHYSLHYRDLCPLTECNNWFSKGRDSVWYFVVAALKSVWSTPLVILWLAAGVLFIKLYIITRLSKNLLLALLIYVGIFYQAHDMTTHRQSMAALFYLLAFYAMVRYRPKTSIPFLLLSGLTHKQAWISALLLLVPWIRRHGAISHRFIVLAISLILLGFYPKLILSNLMGWGVMPVAAARLIESHLQLQQEGWVNLHFRAVPLEGYPLTLFVLYSLSGSGLRGDRVWSNAAASLCIAYFVLWITAGEEILQYRQFYFFLLPLVVLVGCGDLRRLTVISSVILVALYVVKYDLMHPFFVDTAWIKFSVQGNGSINKDERERWVPCGQECRNYSKGPLRFYAVPAEGYRFAGWSGVCDGVSFNCSFIHNGNNIMTARFESVSSLVVTKSGEGVVTAMGGMKCGLDCEQRVDGGQLLGDGGPQTVLRAKSAPGYRFAGWSGACEGEQPTCHLTLDEDRSVEAVFEPIDKLGGGHLP
jgi:hypothetical protein